MKKLPDFAKQIGKALEKQFPENSKQIQFKIEFTRLSRNTFKLSIDLEGKINSANFEIKEGKTTTIPITVNLI